jgi:hypothetical protein
VEHNLQNSTALLARTPAALDALLRGLPEEWTHCNEGDGTFTVVDVIGHLIHVDRENWLPRAHMILDHGEDRPFEPFDRWGHAEICKGKTVPQLLDEFKNVREKCLEELKALDLQPAQLEKRGRHPSFGAVTLSQLLATWAAHDLTHLHQISRIMANQYRDAVGPWKKFLGVMQCDGHSKP